METFCDAERKLLMNRQSVRSTNIRSVGYETKAKLLEIEFQDGRVYQYSNVPESVYQDLIVAKSTGKFFHQYIKSNYRFVRVR